MEWKIRRLEARDEGAFIPFLGQWISKRSVAKHFEWLYRGNPHGQAITWIVVLENGGDIIGCTSIFPRLMRIRGRQFLGSYGGDTFVDPNFRRRGIAQALHEYSLSDMARLDIHCHYGYPVPANFRAFIRAGALALSEFKPFWLPLNAAWIANALSLGPFRSIVVTFLNPAAKLYLNRRALRNVLPGISIHNVDEFDSRVDQLFESVAHRFGVCCTRDANYLNWRFAKNPFKELTLIEWRNDTILVGYAVLDLNGESCQVVDFLTQDDDEMTLGCLATLVRFVIEKSKNSIYMNLNPRGPYASLLNRSGFIQREQGKRLMAIKPSDPEKDEVFDEPDNWFLMPGDDDSV